MRNFLPCFVSRRAGLVIVVGLLAAAVRPGPSAEAALNLTLSDSPDINVGRIGITYDAGTDTFVASGAADELKLDGDFFPILNAAGQSGIPGTFDLSATIDGSGNLSGGVFSIGGSIPTSMPAYDDPLLEGTLTAIGVMGAIPFCTAVC